MVLPYSLAIPFLGIYAEKNMIQKDTCTPMLTEALVTIAKVWKQHIYPWTGEWMKKTWYIYTMKHCSAVKKNKITPVEATQMDLRLSY